MTHLIAHARDERQINSTFACAVFPDSADATHNDRGQMSRLLERQAHILAFAQSAINQRNLQGMLMLVVQLAATDSTLAP